MLTQTSLVEQILAQILPPVTITNIVGEIDIVTPLPLVVMQSVAVVVTELLTALVPVLSLTSTLLPETLTNLLTPASSTN